jgi:CBS domain containing-hemolysin-like protein
MLFTLRTFAMIEYLAKVFFCYFCEQKLSKNVLAKNLKMEGIYLLVLWFSISIIFSFLCSVWEAVLLSISPAFAEMKLQEGEGIGKTLQEFKKNIDRPLAAILTLNTIAHTGGAIGVGASATKIWPGNEMMTGLVVPVVMTLAILILSEIIPKTIGANYWKELAPFTVKSLNFILFILAPIVWVSQLITKALKKEKGKSVLSRADFTAMTDIAEKGGELKQNEYKIIRNLLGFNKILAKDVMTPRTVVVAADETTTIRGFYEKNKNLRFSRVPLFQDTKDQITGYFLKDQLLASLIEKKDNELLSSIKRELIVVNDKCPIPDLFNQFMEKREHIALVVGDFGGMSGIVSLEDVIETLLGLEIVDEYDGTDDMQILARQKWEERAKKLGLIQGGNIEEKDEKEN